MARTPRNRINTNITDENNVIEYLNQFSKMNIQAAGGYSKNINNDGWVTQSGGLEVSNQGHMKAMAWSISILSLRAETNDAEARTIVANICSIMTAASKFKLAEPHSFSIPSVVTSSREVKPEGDAVKVENIDSHVHTYQPNN
jgi:hypothetical protein